MSLAANPLRGFCVNFALLNQKTKTMKKVIMLIMPLMLTVVSVQAQNQKEMKGSNINLEKELPANVWNIVKMLEEKKTDEAIVIKLAERLHNMRTIEFIDDSKKAKKVKETIEIYLPLARRINNQKLIDELNDLSMKYNV